MTADTFVPAMGPSVNSPKTITYRVKKSQFGDNWVQKAGDGINTKMVSWDLTWAMMLSTDAASIESFMDALAGFGTFLYTVPGDIQRKYTCEGAVRTPLADDFETVTATVVEFQG